PATLADALDVEVRGEVFLTESAFAAAQDRRRAEGGTEFVNARNGAAGILRKGNPAFADLLTFAAYDVSLTNPEVAVRSHDERLNGLEGTGALTARALAASAPPPYPVTELGQEGIEEVLSRVAQFDAARTAGLPYPTDGIVIKADRDAGRVRLGEGSRAPKW